ncbi:MAG: DUF3592 domain-containing protein [Maricaulaceae bacterium]
MPYRITLALMVGGVTVWAGWTGLFDTVPLVKALEERGVRVQGEITEISAPYRVRWRSRGARVQDIHYRFEVRGAVYEGEVRESRQTARRFRVGAPLGVDYLPEAPARHRSVLHGRPTRSYVLNVTAILGGGGFLLAAFWIWRMPRDWRPRLWPLLSNEIR